ncbi:MAG: DNA ligase [Thermoprotei archaeon]|nr:MAG: DNA ligase [Thermoprotei archaeon]
MKIDGHSFKELCELCEKLESTSSRNAMITLVSDFLEKLSLGELAIASNLIIGRVFPVWDQRELEVSGATLVKVIKRIVGVDDRGFLKAFNETGDFGSAVKLLFERRRHLRQAMLMTKPLSIEEVHRGLEAIAEAKGAGSRKKKERILEALLSRASPLEAKYIVKAILGERRHGFGEALMEEAVAKAFNVPVEEIRRANMLTSDLGLVARTAALEQLQGLRRLGVMLFHPLRPMLAEKVETVAEALREHGGEAALEYKLDGARLQIHKKGEVVKVYSRHLTEVTDSLPEVVKEVREGLRAQEAVVEGEAVAIGEDGRPKPFQQVMRRLRRVKLVEEKSEEIPIKLYLFDLLYLNGERKIDEPYMRRRALLEEIAGTIPLVEVIFTKNVSEAEDFFKKALEAGHEGVMVKDLTSTYTPGVRGRKWLKVKAGPLTLDLVIVAAEYGHGYRYKWLSDYHLAAYNPATGEFEVIGKCFTGLTDDEIDYMTRRLKELAIAERGRMVLVEPRIVVEVGFAELQESPHYKAGVALRFPRILRIREDKSPQEADTIDKVKKLYEKQFKLKSR